MADLVTLSSAQSFVQDSTSASEAWVQTCLDAASQAVIDFLGVDPSVQVRTENLSGANTKFLMPRAAGKVAPISSVSAITINPGLSDRVGGGWWGVGFGATPVAIQPVSVNLTNVSWDESSIFFLDGRNFPRGRRNISVTFVSGYVLPGGTAVAGVSNLPNAITQAILYTAKAFFTALGKELNATSESYAGVLSQGFNAGGPGGMPPAAQALLTPYRSRLFSG